MIKRLTWFAGGVATGIVGLTAAKRKVRSVAQDLAPVQVVKRAGGEVRSKAQHVADAVREGKRAMQAKETELRARLDGRASTLADELPSDATVLVDGRPVEPGQVIVLRDVRDDRVAGRRRDDRRPRRRA